MKTYWIYGFPSKNKYNKKRSREEMEQGVESLFKEIIAESFPNLGRGLDIYIHEVNR